MLRSDAHHTRQRVKVGVIGLAAVVALIVMASAIWRVVSRERPVAVAGTAKPDTVANLTLDNAAGTEPLPELALPQPAANSSAGP